MRAFLVSILGICCAISTVQAGAKVKWPKDAFEWANVEEAKEEAAKEGKAICVIFCPDNAIDPKAKGAVATFDITNDAISATKSFCVIVKGQMAAVKQPESQEEADKLKPLAEGVGKAGNSYPLVVVLDSGMETLVAGVSAQTIHDEGRKAFRDAKRAFKKLEDEKEDEEK